MSRLVVLPDFQGLGIGTKINEFIGQYYVQNGYKFYIRTSHVRMIRHLSHSDKWLESSSSGVVSHIDGGDKMMSHDLKRVCASFEYVGKDYFTKPHRVIKVNQVNDLNRFLSQLQQLKQKYYIIVVTGTSTSRNELEQSIMKMGIRIEPLYSKNDEHFININDENLFKYSNIKFYDENIDMWSQYDGNNYMKLAGKQLDETIQEINSNKIDNTIYDVEDSSMNMKKVSLIDF